MFIANTTILHVVYTATGLSASTFLDKHGKKYGQSVDGIWLALNARWCTLYKVIRIVFDPTNYLCLHLIHGDS